MNPAEDYIINQPEPYRSMLLHIQLLIEKTIPEASLRYKYKIPFYYFKGKPLCYLNASHKGRFVDVGFWKGNQLKTHTSHFVTKNRKMIVSLRYQTLSAINTQILTDVLGEAISLY